MKRLMLLCIGLALLMPDANAFCGFFVAKADSKLFNKTSQVIYVRNGQRSTITMSNDYSGKAKDFAMVVPVPVVLQEHEIKVMERVMFDRFDSYSAPRLAAYYDYNPCSVEIAEVLVSSQTKRRPRFNRSRDKQKEDKNGVTIEAKYSVGEYDILILSAKESSGLKTWLTENKYQLPEGAEEVLDPYIASGMKFFVAKVNLGRHAVKGFAELSPIQISFESQRFMLPIRLGMANADGDQDLIVYAFTKTGRVETSNYRTMKIPTDVEVPLFVQNDFGRFYKDLFDRAYRKESGKTAFLEYAWDVSMQNPVKCDPCVSPPPVVNDLQLAGVNWANGGKVFFTRLHIRYNRQNFPQDLMFQETPNQDRFQGRYVIHHPPTGEMDCDAGQEYLLKLELRREEEVYQLAALTGWEPSQYQEYIKEFSGQIKDEFRQKNTIEPALPDDNGGGYGWQILMIIAAGSVLLIVSLRQLSNLKIKQA